MLLDNSLKGQVMNYLKKLDRLQNMPWLLLISNHGLLKLCKVDSTKSLTIHKLSVMTRLSYHHASL